MKITKLSILAFTALVPIAIGITACSSSKKAGATVASSNPTSTTNATKPVTTPPFMVGGSADGIYPPGNNELTAIQVKHKDVTLEKLQEGYKIYTQGACINCHMPENIYVHAEDQWEGIVDDMAKKANISYEEKDAVYKYVLAIKAIQPK